MVQRTLYIFNPDNDLALANGDTNYMAPASARRMVEELALLPVWYACSGGVVLASSSYNLAYLQKMQTLFPLSVSLLTQTELLSFPSDVQPSPWGWNPALRKHLLTCGVPENSIPSVSDIGCLRQLSHRSQAVNLLPVLQLDEYFCGESFYLTDEVVCRRFVESSDTCLLKAPWSGSGKGLNWCKGVFTPHIAGWCARVSALQGGVVGEPLYDKVEDFAMEFQSDGKGSVHFAGYSLFSTGSSGAYEGNLLLTDSEIELRLSHYVSVNKLQRLKNALEAELSVRVGSEYSGYLGVDMMVCRFHSATPVFRIHPCVEINLRMNMGMVARLLCDRYVQSGASGVFRVTYHPESGAALREDKEMQVAYPLEVQDGRVVAGYLPLVPVTGRSCYRAWMLV